MFINACGEFANISHPAHKVAQEHKRAVLACLTQKLALTTTDNVEQKAMNLFIYSEGLIVARQTGIMTQTMLKSLPNLI